MHIIIIIIIIFIIIVLFYFVFMRVPTLLATRFVCLLTLSGRPVVALIWFYPALDRMSDHPVQIP